MRLPEIRRRIGRWLIGKGVKLLLNTRPECKRHGPGFMLKCVGDESTGYVCIRCEQEARAELAEIKEALIKRYP